MISTGIVGLGFGERVHVPAFRRSGRFEVTAVSSKTRGKASEAAKRLNITKPYEDWMDLLEDEEIRVVSIATPPNEQVEVALAAIKKGKQLFLEKPVALNLPQAEMIRTAARKSKTAVMVDFEFCEIEEWKRAKDLLNDGAIGTLRQIAVSWHLETYASRQRIDSWKLRTLEGGGAFFQFMPHVLYYLEWFAGPLAALSARIDGQEIKIPKDFSVALSAEFKNGAIASVSIITNAFSGTGHRIEFYGTEGTMILESSYADPVGGFTLKRVSRTGASETFVGKKSMDEDGRIKVVAAIVSRLADWIDKGISSVPSIEEGCRVQHLLDAALRANKEGRRVTGLEKAFK